MDLSELNNSFKTAPTKSEVPLPAAIQASQKRVASARAQVSAIARQVPSGRGTAQLTVNLCELNAKAGTVRARTGGTIEVGGTNL